jgi:hypothetical protein
MVQNANPWDIVGSRPSPLVEDPPSVLFPVHLANALPDLDWEKQLQGAWKEIGLPAESYVPPQDFSRAYIVKYVKMTDQVVRDELSDLAPQNKIPPQQRTKPMPLGQAAKLMGYEGNKEKAGKSLRAAMDRGAVRFEKIGRQRFVFSKGDFPEIAQDKL